MVKQISLDSWSIQHLKDLLRKGSLLVEKTNTPIILYRQVLEEEDSCYEEIVCTLTHDFVLEQLVTSGGMVVPKFQQQLVFTIHEFPTRLMKKSKELFSQCVDSLENQLK